MNDETNILKFSDLKKLYPEVFKSIRPLKIGIFNDLKEIHGDNLPKKSLHAMLGAWARSPSYLVAISYGGPRYSLDGSQCGEISEIEIADAKNKLEMFHRKRIDDNNDKKNRSQLLKSFEASGLSKQEFAVQVKISKDQLYATLDKALAERRNRIKLRKKIVEEFDKSGLPIEEFAKSSKYSLYAVQKALKKIRGD